MALASGFCVLFGRAASTATASGLILALVLLVLVAVRGPAALSGDLTPFLGVHGSKAAPAIALALTSIALILVALPGLTTPASGLLSLFTVPLMGGATLVGSSSSLAGDFTLFLGVHRSKAAPAPPLVAALLVIVILVGTTPSSVRGPAALSGDLALFLGVHGSKAASAPPLAATLLAAPAAALAATLLVIILVGTTPTSVRGPAALAGDLTLLLGVHRCKATSAPPLASALLVIFILAGTTPSSVRGPAALAGDLPLLFRVHTGKPATTTFILVLGVGSLAMAVSTSTVFVSRAGMPPPFLMLPSLVMLGGAAMVMRCRLVVVGRVVVVGRETAEPADLCHVLAISADCPASSPPSLGRFLFVPFVSVATLVRGAATLAGNRPLLFGVHCRESALAVGVVPSHFSTPFGGRSDAARASPDTQRRGMVLH